MYNTKLWRNFSYPKNGRHNLEDKPAGTLFPFCHGEAGFAQNGKRHSHKDALKHTFPLKNMPRVISAKKHTHQMPSPKDQVRKTHDGLFYFRTSDTKQSDGSFKTFTCFSQLCSRLQLCRMHCCIPPGPTGKSSIQPSYIMLQNPKNEMKVILQCSYKQPHPQTKSLNNSGGQGHLITVSSVWEGQAYKNRKAP